VVVVDLLTGEEVVAPGVGFNMTVPRWSHDGSKLAFTSLAEGGADVVIGSYTWSVFDGEEPRPVQSNYPLTFAHDWTPEGDRLITAVAPVLGEPTDIATMSSDGSDPTPYLQAPWVEDGPRVSPDGMWLAYASNQTGELQILLRSFPAPGEALTLATDPRGITHLWGPDGRTLYYTTSDSIKAVELEFEPEPVVASRRALFSLRRPEGLLTTGDQSNFAFHPDRGFVMVLTDEVDASGIVPRTYLVVNWFRELRELVGGT
jgi:hypothetical protein